MNYIIDLKDEINPTTGEFVEREIEKAKAAGYKSLTLIINSFGGSVYEGLSIVSALKNSGMETTAKIEGYCASMAAIIAMTCDKVVMAEHGILMFHNPYLEGREDMSESEKSAMEKTTNSLIMLASRKIDKNTLKKMMDKETWLDAAEAFGFGMVDEIYDINKLSDYGLAKEFNEAIVNKNENLLNSIYNKLKLSMEKQENTIEEIKDETSVEMEEKVKDSSHEKIVIVEEEEDEEEEKEEVEEASNEMDYKQMYENLLEKYESMKNSADTIQLQLDEMLKKENEFNYNRALERVATAVNEGRIEESSKSEWIETLQNNFDLGVKMLNTIKVSTKAPIMPFNNKAKVESVKNEWTIRDYEEKDPKALKEILQNNKPLYKQMFYDYYGVEYKG